MTVRDTEMLVAYGILALRLAAAIAAYFAALVPLVVWWHFGFEPAVVIGIGLVLFGLVRIAERLELNRQAIDRQP